MTPAARKKLRLALERLRAKITRAGPAKIEPNRTDPATTGVADEDAQALSEMLQVLASQRNRGQADLVARIDEALRKLHATPEDFGLCEDCEEEIDARRLSLMPYATRCPACQAKAEPKLGGTRKKLTDFR
ncbi:MAG TPA: TraR/DksA C4-type zinc finger protein [Anaeromyxobacteraceae bacterium]|nr:TraR/DksA C4-type zinc finger protein [Anaeromyxobacteraceae bacterium]